MDKKIRILICDDSKNTCESYKLFIECEEDMECVGYVTGSKDCLNVVKEVSPDLLLLDIQMESEDSGIKILPSLKQAAPDMKIIMLTGYDNNEYVFKSIINGADAYVLKQMNGKEMFNEIRRLYLKAIESDNKEFDYMDKFKYEANAVFDKLNIMHCMMDDMVKLTESEYKLLKSIYYGKTYKTIAKERFVEETTIKTTASRILKKLNVVSMKQLIRLLKETNFFED